MTYSIEVDLRERLLLARIKRGYRIAAYLWDVVLQHEVVEVAFSEGACTDAIFDHLSYEFEIGE